MKQIEEQAREIENIKKMQNVLLERDDALRDEMITIEWAIKDLKERMKEQEKTNKVEETVDINIGGVEKELTG